MVHNTNVIYYIVRGGNRLQSIGLVHTLYIAYYSCEIIQCF